MSTQLPETFEPENQDSNVWDLIPPGEYAGQIVEASVAQPKSMDGYHIALVWKILEGNYENRQVWQRITYQHSSAQAQNIGRKMLKDLTKSLEVNEHIEDVEVFLFKPCRIKVGIEKDKDGAFDDKNKITRILPYNPPPAAVVAPSGPKPSQAAVAVAPQPVANKGPVRPGPAGTAPWHQQQR